jgi:hypothetical protein
MTITLLWELWATGSSLSGSLLGKQQQPPRKRQRSRRR